jgi:hypothetical protein
MKYNFPLVTTTDVTNNLKSIVTKNRTCQTVLVGEVRTYVNIADET